MGQAELSHDRELVEVDALADELVTLEEEVRHIPPRRARWGECLAKWQRDHAGLHGYATLREELDRRFKQRYFAWAPYLYGELGAAVEQEERALIDAGAIQATGFHYVGER